MRLWTVIQLDAVLSWSNITWFVYVTAVIEAEYDPEFEPTKCTPNLALMGDMGVSSVRMLEKINLKNIERHTAHIIVSWPNPKQWISSYIWLVEGILPKGPYLLWRVGPFLHDTIDLLMIIRQSVYSLNHHKENGSTENTQPLILYNG